MSKRTLNEIANAIVGGYRGVLAADESTATIGKRFAMFGVDNTEENRRAYRELLVTTKDAADHVGGVIFCEETLGQRTKDGRSFVELLQEEGVAAGIKVDKGIQPMPFAPGESITEGLDGLRQRLDGYAKRGVEFAKWRAVIDIAPGLPSDLCLRANAEALARYAALCQEAGIVPIVEPEVLMDGDHGLDRCYEISRHTLAFVFEALYQHRVALEGILLKPNMVIPGKKARDQSTTEDIADATVRLMKQSVPAAVPGIVFLSGGRSEAEATANLNAINVRHKNLPWKLSFSYGRALQQSALRAWSGEAAKVQAGQSAFALRAKLNALAARGAYSPAMEP